MLNRTEVSFSDVCVKAEEERVVLDLVDPESGVAMMLELEPAAAEELGEALLEAAEESAGNAE